MYTFLGDARLKNGERLVCGVVDAPDAEWAPRIDPFLAHKRPEWRYHISEALARPLDRLETRFYVGTLGEPEGPVITDVMVASARGVGLLGHVYTAPEHRQQGAYSQLMAHQMAHSASLGHHTLTLSTGFESPAYWIYQRFGFRSIDGISGRMKWLASPDAEARWFRPGETRAHAMVWDDWTTLNLAVLRIPAPGEVHEERPRSWAFRIMTYGTAEGTFAQVFAPWSRQPRQAARYAATLRTAHGAVVGWAILKPDEMTLGEDLLFDLYVHPAFVDDAWKLLQDVPWPEGERVAAYTSLAEGRRAALLHAAGFRHAAVLPGWLGDGSGRMDVHAFARGS